MRCIFILTEPPAATEFDVSPCHTAEGPRGNLAAGIVETTILLSECVEKEKVAQMKGRGDNKESYNGQ